MSKYTCFYKYRFFSSVDGFVYLQLLLAFELLVNSLAVKLCHPSPMLAFPCSDWLLAIFAFFFKCFDWLLAISGWTFQRFDWLLTVITLFQDF